MMRTTLDIDDDVLEAVKEIATREKMTAGAVLSKLAREAILGSGSAMGELTPITQSSGGFGESEQPAILQSLLPTFPPHPRKPGGPQRLATLAHIAMVEDEIEREDMERALNPGR